jgi:hypothetical protein
VSRKVKITAEPKRFLGFPYWRAFGEAEAGTYQPWLRARAYYPTFYGEGRKYKKGIVKRARSSEKAIAKTQARISKFETRHRIRQDTKKDRAQAKIERKVEVEVDA